MKAWSFLGRPFTLALSFGRDTETRCLCGHLLFIHVDADVRPPERFEDEPFSGFREIPGSCMYSDCACSEPRSAAAYTAPESVEAA